MTTPDLHEKTSTRTRVSAVVVSVLLFVLTIPFVVDYVGKHARRLFRPGIAPDEVKLTDLTMNQSQPNTAWHMVGYIENTSPKYTLTSMKVTVEARDFPADVDTRTTPPLDQEAPVLGTGELS